MNSEWKTKMKEDFAWYINEIQSCLDLEGMERHLTEWRALGIPSDYPGTDVDFLFQEAVDLMDALLVSVWKKNPSCETQGKKDLLENRRLKRASVIPFQLGE